MNFQRDFPRIHPLSRPLIFIRRQFISSAIPTGYIDVIELLVKAGSVLYYAGDFDPEGLGMTNRLVKCFGSAVRLRHHVYWDSTNSR
ncbi:DUF2399 domain-containing protein [Pseudogracilibacillus auburnensis]|uniref:DUF2399 domain-containing protein n=1 Tax=Pseudogracilibacillus auburnensis TaxID=1494959 RepID=UPI001A9662C3|nr:DUF2399 domain-containing protein [Pseudogracilibacillus auburnensis]MBO1005279.1 DUF2399 domain-containing protein [Pseudogracilibacillus auburnensis]